MMKLGKMFNEDFCVNFSEALSAVLEKPIPGKTVHKLGRIMEKFDLEKQDAYKTRSRFIDMYATKKNGKIEKADNGGILFSKENWELYQSVCKSLGEFEVDFPKISLLELGDNEFLGKHLLVLSDIIESDVADEEIKVVDKTFDLPTPIQEPVSANDLPAADPAPLPADPAPLPADPAPLPADPVAAPLPPVEIQAAPVPEPVISNSVSETTPLPEAPSSGT
jgi:hypothetical protein